MCLIEFSWEAIWSWTFVYIIYSNSLLVNNLFKLSISSWFFVGYMFLESCPSLLDCQICWHIIVHSIFLWFFVFLQYQLRFLLFHFLFGLVGFSLCFLVSLARSLSVLFTLSNYQLMVLLNFFSLFFKNLFYLFSLWLCYFLLSADFRFYLFFFF